MEEIGFGPKHEENCISTVIFPVTYHMLMKSKILR